MKRISTFKEYNESSDNKFETLVETANKIANDLNFRITEVNTYEWEDPESYDQDEESKAIYFDIESPAFIDENGEPLEIQFAINALEEFQFIYDSVSIGNSLFTKEDYKNSHSFGEIIWKPLNRLNAEVYQSMIENLKNN